MTPYGDRSAATRVAVVTMSFPWPSETFASRDFRALRERGIAVEVYPLRPPRPQQRGVAEQQQVTGIPVRPSTFGGGLRSFGSAVPGRRTIARLARRIAFDGQTSVRERLKCLALLPRAAHAAAQVVRAQPDVLHLYWGHYPSLVLLLARAHLPRTRFTMFLGAYDLERSLGISRWAAEACGHIFTHAHANVSEMSRFLGSQDRIVVVHRGIDLSRYPSEVESARSGKTGTVFSASRFIPNKGVDQVIRVFHQVSVEHPGTTLRLAGDGPSRPEMEALVRALGIEKSVTFLGWLNEDRIREEMLQAKIFMALSTKAGERLPNAVKEAMAAGCVCVVLDAPGMDELIEHGRDGYIVPVDRQEVTPEYVARHIDVPDFEPIQRAAAEKIRRYFDVRASAAEYARRWRERMTSPNVAPERRERR